MPNLNRRCLVRVKGVDADWLAAVVVSDKPKQARITANDPVWRGALVNTRSGVYPAGA